jgi:hypothetical protein
MVYGAGDPLHRFSALLKRMDDGRPAIIIEETWARAVANAAGWNGRIVILPRENTSGAPAASVQCRTTLDHGHNSHPFSGPPRHGSSIEVPSRVQNQASHGSAHAFNPSVKV